MHHFFKDSNRGNEGWKIEIGISTKMKRYGVSSTKLAIKNCMERMRHNQDCFNSLCFIGFTTFE